MQIFLSAFGRKSGTGFGDIAVGIKQQLGPLPGGFDVAIAYHNRHK